MMRLVPSATDRVVLSRPPPSLQCLFRLQHPALADWSEGDSQSRASYRIYTTQPPTWGGMQTHYMITLDTPSLFMKSRYNSSDITIIRALFPIPCLQSSVAHTPPHLSSSSASWLWWHLWPSELSMSPLLVQPDPGASLTSDPAVRSCTMAAQTPFRLTPVTCRSILAGRRLP